LHFALPLGLNDIPDLGMIIPDQGTIKVATSTQKVQSCIMKRSVDLDEELEAQVDETASLIREKPSIVIRLAVRAGLPVVANRFQSPRPEGYFAHAYKDGARAKLEDAAGAAVNQVPER